jgi:hypothetical protein
MTRRTTHAATAAKKKRGCPRIIFKSGVAGLRGGIGGRLRKPYTVKGVGARIKQADQMGYVGPSGREFYGKSGGVLVLGKKAGGGVKCVTCGRCPKNKGKGRGPKVRYLPLCG